MTTSSDPIDAISSSLSGENIASLLRAEGPIVSCVLLRAKPPTLASSTTTENRPDNNDEHPNAVEINAGPAKESSFGKTNDTDDEKDDLTDLIAEIPIDTTPKKSMVSKILGGPFTFLGQYEDEGIVVMIREEANNSSEGGPLDLVRNPHKLQPPLHGATVYGDILLMRVADTPEEDGLDSERKDLEDEGVVGTKSTTDTDQENKTAVDDELTNEEEISTSCESIKTNEEFFLNYTKAEYITFASRTDILPEESDEDDGTAGNEHDVQADSDSDSDEEDGGGEEGEDGEYTIDSDEDIDSDDEDCQIGMMNLILGQILKRFQEVNGRGPDTHELLTMRSGLAEKLGIDGIPPVHDDTDLKDEGDNGESKLETSSQASKDNESKEDKASSTEGKRKRTFEDKENDGGKRVKFSNKDQIKIIEGYTSNNESTDEGETSAST